MLRGNYSGKVVSARQAAELIRDGDTVATSGFVGIGIAENLAVAIAPVLSGKSHLSHCTFGLLLSYLK